MKRLSERRQDIINQYLPKALNEEILIGGIPQKVLDKANDKLAKIKIPAEVEFSRKIQWNNYLKAMHIRMDLPRWFRHPEEYFGPREENSGEMDKKLKSINDFETAVYNVLTKYKLTKSVEISAN